MSTYVSMTRLSQDVPLRVTYGTVITYVQTLLLVSIQLAISSTCKRCRLIPNYRLLYHINL
jgi:hypothetical protein